jgi:CheY-like chemotaxis protein
MNGIYKKERNVFDIKYIKILVAEDDRIIARDLQYTLESHGYHVCAIVASGEECIEKALYFQPDLVLMDIKLNGNMDGMSAAQQIYDRFQIPVVYLTAYGDEKTLARAKKAECFGFVIKPFDENMLQQAIEQSLIQSVKSEPVHQDFPHLSKLAVAISPKKLILI